MSDEQLDRLEDVISAFGLAVDKLIDNFDIRKLEDAAQTMSSAAQRMNEAAGTMYAAGHR